eukprot:NODE_11967_length_423_cov_16.623333_g11309_i0.p1 GENE.NODE_11967_length_423_cov_16.623333_g11309_i0~~NODE_11967_length_423_cov_16.623333_g11309_i0.p1  ORF type:complete len:116 (-),score=21.89 NODE_11967_length_423_cov_16.623333_g11309_i0:74-388(-)
MFQMKTAIEVYPGTATSGPVAFRITGDVLGGEFNVLDSMGRLTATVERNYGKGIVVQQNYSLVICPNADTVLMILLLIMVNCMKNDRNKLFATLGSVFAATIVI